MNFSRWREWDREDEKLSWQDHFSGGRADGTVGRVAGFSADSLPAYGAAGRLQSRGAPGQSRHEVRGLPRLSRRRHLRRHPGARQVRGLPRTGHGRDGRREAFHRYLCHTRTVRCRGWSMRGSRTTSTSRTSSTSSWARLACDQCHGPQGKTDKLRPYEQDRISGYSRDIWGHSMSRIGLRPGDGKKMTDCESCHRERGVAQAESCLACHK